MSTRPHPLVPSVLALALLAAPVFGAEPAPEAPSRAATISVDEVRVGQRGHGLTVFAGTEPERFEVEVIGVMRNISPGTSYILARLTGHGLEKSGVAGGMSGSPVYLDGRLAGAVAFSWSFSHEAVGGITPIESMRSLASVPATAVPAAAAPDLPDPAAGPPVELADLLTGRLPADLLVRELSTLRPRLAVGGVASLQWATSGFGELSQGLLRQALGSVAPAGRADAETAPKAAGLVPGGAVGAVLVDGDLRLAAFGTVTDRFDDHVLAFGHPFLGLGPIRLPMATAEVVTILSSANSSFKISNLGTTVGAFEQDRLAGIQGRLGASAPMVPLTLRILGDQPREFRVRVAEVPQITPLLVASSALGALEAATYSAGTHTIDMTARFQLKDRGELLLRQSFEGDRAATDSATFLLGVAGYLVQNQLERVGIDEIEVELVQSDRPSSAQLVGAHAERTVVRPGERITVNLDLVPYRGEPFRRSFALVLPEDLPAGRYSLLVGDGTSADAARLAIEPADPVTFAQALELLRSLHSRREIVALGVFSGSGLAVAGEVMPRLPGSVQSLWTAAASGSAAPLKTAIAQRHVEPMDMPVEGLVRIDLEVRRREPVTAGSDAAPQAPGDASSAGVDVDGAAGMRPREER